MWPWWWQPNLNFEIKKVGDGTKNGIVIACLQVLANGFQEAPLEQMTKTGKLWETDEDSEAALVWLEPNQFMDDSDLIWYATWSTRVDGNAYLAKVRDQRGTVVEYWPLLPHLVSPKRMEDVDVSVQLPDGVEPNGFIDFYEYSPDGRTTFFLPEDIIHLKIGLDPTDHRLGFAPLKGVLREVFGDDEASRFSAALLGNMAVPGVILSPKDPTDIGPDEDEAEGMKEAYQERFGGTERGKPLVMTSAMDVQVVSFSPEQMDFKALRRLPEERVCAVLGVPPIVAYLGAGLDRSTLANTEESGEDFAERTLVPGWRNLGKQLTRQGRDDWGLSRNQALRFDTREVRSLQEDRDELFTRLDRGVRSGWIQVSEAKKEVGLEPLPTDDVYLRSLTVQAVPAGQNIIDIEARELLASPSN